MLEQFTWGQFLGCYGALSLLWYLGLLFTAYRKEAMGMLGIGADGDRKNGILKFKSQSEAVPDKGFGSGLLLKEKKIGHRTGEDAKAYYLEAGAESGMRNHGAKEMEENKPDEGLMGKVNPPPGVERIETGSLAFAKGVLEGTVHVENGGLYEDLTNGIREIYAILAANDGNKQDFFGMVEGLKAEMGPVGSSPCIQSVNTYIRDSAPFAISSEELESLWD